MSKLYVGIDIGGTLTKLGLVDENGDSDHQTEFRTRHYPDLKDYQQKIVDTVKELDELVPEHDVQGIGIGAPNANYFRGTIEHAANLSFKGIVPMVEDIQRMTGLPAVITNDANAAALGEMKYGNAKEMKNFIVITLGTGLGSGIVVDGKLVYGHDAAAGELGHVQVVPGGRLCGTGNRGCLEAYVSSTGLKRTIMYLLADTLQDSVFRSKSFNDLHGHEITQAAEEGDPIAVEAFAMTGRILGEQLANFVAFSQPEAFFLLGGLAKAGKWIFDPAREAMEKHMLEVYKGKVKVLPSGMEGNNAAILGAAAMIHHELETA